MSYLLDTLDSLGAAGFDPLVVQDRGRDGSWPVMLRSLSAMLAYGGWEAAIVFQDDLHASRSLKDYLVSELWPDSPDSVGTVSLYNPASRHQSSFGWFRIPMDRPAEGALAFVFPRHAAESMVRNPPCREFRTNSGQAVWKFCGEHKAGWWEHSPSLVYHRGDVSAIDVHNRMPPNAGAMRMRQCRQFIPDLAVPSIRQEFSFHQE